METKNLEYEKLYIKAYKKVFKNYFHKLTFEENEELKVPKNHKELQEKGVDKMKIKVLEGGITGLKERDWKVNIRGENFTKLYSGIKKNNFWCYLELNPSKVLYENNIRNVRGKELLEKVFSVALKEISEYGYTIETSLCELASLEVNEMLILDHSDTNEKTFKIITDEISKGHFKTKSNLYKQSLKPNSFTIGTKEKGVSGYDKTIEVIVGEFKKSKKKFPPITEVRRVAKKYKTFFRVEVTRGAESLKNLLGSEKIKLDYFLENPEEIIDEVFDTTTEEAGLTEMRVEEINSKKIKNLSLKFKRYIRMHGRLFIVRFLKDYQSQIWGVEQLMSLVDHIGGSSNLKKMRKRSLKKNYKQIKNPENKKLDAFKCLKNIIGNI